MKLIFYLPFFAAVALTPLLFGSVRMPAQLFLGACVGVCLLASMFRPPTSFFSRIEKSLIGAGIISLLITIVPMPSRVVEMISPARAALAKEFPVNRGEIEKNLTLTISPSGTIQRLWQLALLAAFFLVAYSNASRTEFKIGLYFAVLLGLGGLIISEWWLRIDGHGVWEGTRTSQAGTFFNRNHFANWVSVASVFLLGVTLQFLHLRRTNAEKWWKTIEPWSALTLVCMALWTSSSTGSRGGLISLAVGLLLFVLLTWRRHYSRNFPGSSRCNSSPQNCTERRFPSMMAAFTLLLAIILGSAFALDRFAESSINLRTNIWSDTLRIFNQFPFFGTGPGTFLVAFSHYKTFHGYGTFLHAENDYVQTLMEFGLIPLGCFVMAAAVFLIKRRAGLYRAINGMTWEHIGLFSSLAVFLVHANFEFVFQTMANATLFSVLAGLALGTFRDQYETLIARNQSDLRSFASNGRSSSPVYSKFSLLQSTLAVIILGMTLLQATALHYWKTPHNPADFGQIPTSNPALRYQLSTVSPGLAGMYKGVSLWPIPVDWQLVFARSAVAELNLDQPSVSLEQSAGKVQEYLFVRDQLDSAVKLNPYEWRLRFERALLDLAFAPDINKGIAEAKLVLRLNPLQPELPFRFAELLVDRHPNQALEFVRVADISDNNSLRRALRLVWRVTGDPSALWEITPATPQGLIVLGDFAASNHLDGIAVRAFQQAARQPSLSFDMRVTLAHHLLRHKKPDQVLALVSKNGSITERKIIFKALSDQGKIAEALAVGEEVCRSKYLPQKLPEQWRTYQRTLTGHDFPKAHQLLSSMVEKIED